MFSDNQLYQMTKFQPCPNWKPFQTTNQIVLNAEIWLRKVRKHCGKRRKCWLPAFSLLLSLFSEGFSFKDCWKSSLLVKAWSSLLYVILIGMTQRKIAFENILRKQENAGNQQAFENIVGKVENAGNQLFLFSDNVFYPFKIKFQFWFRFILSSANAFNLDQSKILLFGKGLWVWLVVWHSENWPIAKLCLRSACAGWLALILFCKYRSSLTCIQRPPKGSGKSGFLQQVIFECRFCHVNLRKGVVSA